MASDIAIPKLIVSAIVNVFIVMFRHDHRHLYDLMAGTVVVERNKTTDTDGVLSLTAVPGSAT